MEECRKALSEVSVIISNIPEELQAKISENFKNTIEKEKDKEYNPNINDLVIENEILPETVIILGMIYRDFLCSEDERGILKKEEQEKTEKQYKENLEKYSYENLFKKSETDDLNNEKEKKELSLIEIKAKWYEKVLEIFRNILRK